MPTEIKLDTSRFNNAMRDYLYLTSKDGVEVLNVKAYWVARNALEMTKRASKPQIRKYYNVKNKAAVVAAVRKFKLTRANSKKELRDGLNKMKAQAVSAVGSLAAGWVPALRKFGGWAKQSKSVRGTRMKGVKGRAKLASRNDGMKAFAAIENCMPAKAKKSKAGAAKAFGRWATRALNASFKREAMSMEKYMKQKFDQSARKVAR